MVDCVEFKTLAAFVNPPFSATATKLLSKSVSNMQNLSVRVFWTHKRASRHSAGFHVLRVAIGRFIENARIETP